MKWDNQSNVILSKYEGYGAERVYSELTKRGYEFSFEGVTRHIRRYRHQRALNLKINHLILDVEATGLEAPWDHLLTWAAYDGQSIFTDTITREEAISYEESDKRILKSLIETICKYDNIITYYGGIETYSNRFDLKMIFTRALGMGLYFPPYGTLTQTDMYDVSKKRLKMHSYSLKAVCEYLGIKGKTPIDNRDWRMGSKGHEKSLQRILYHNIQDVKILYRYWQKMRKYFQPRRIIF